MATHSLPEGHKYTHVLVQPSESIYLPLEYEGTVKQTLLSTFTKKVNSTAGSSSSSSLSSKNGNTLTTEIIAINTIMRDYIKDLLAHGHGDAVRSIANPKYVLRPLVKDASFLDEFGLLDPFDSTDQEQESTKGKHEQNSNGIASALSPLQKVIPLYTQSSSSSSAVTTLLPEIAYTVPSSSSSSIYIAEGKGVLKCSELSGGLILYEGEWHCGMRHGAGRGTIFVRSLSSSSSSTDGTPSSSSQAIFLGVYEGTWVCGLRHGRGIFTEDAGCKYEGEWAFDIKHGQGIETSAGGGVYRGAWCRGQRHGCGTFIWPNGRSESREYEHGNIIAVRVNTNIVPNTPSLVPEMNINGTLSRIASGLNLNIPPTTATVSTTNGSTTTTTLQLFRSAGIPPTPSMTNLQASATAAASAANAAAIAAKAQLQMNASLTTTLSPHTGVLENMDNSTVAPNNANLILAEALQNSITAENNATAATLLTSSASTSSITGLSLDHAATSPTSSSAVLPSLVTTYGGIPFLHHHHHLQFPVVTASGKPVSVSLNADVLRLLRHTSVGDLPAYRGKVVSVEKRDTVESCLTKMSDRNVLSVPVYDAEAGRYVAVLHMLDLFAFMLDLVAKKKATFSPSSGGLRETLAHQKRFALAPVSEVLAMARHLSPIAFRPLPAGTPLIYAAQILAEGGHAVPIVDSMTHRTYSISDSSTTPVNNSSGSLNNVSTPSTPVGSHTLSLLNNAPLSPHPSSAFLPLPTVSTVLQRSSTENGAPNTLTATASFSSNLSPKPKSSSASSGGSGPGTVTPTSVHTAPSSPASNSPSFTANTVSTATLANIPPISTGTSGSPSPVPPSFSSSSSNVSSANDTPTAVPTSPHTSVTPPGVPNTNTPHNGTNNHTSGDSAIPGNIVRMITQADIIRYVAAHLDQLGPLGTMTVAELGLGTNATNNTSNSNDNGSSNDNNLVIARFTDRAFDVLQAMRARHAPAAPVVDQYGAMAANLSLSDVKTIARRANFSALNLPISQFFRAVDKGVEAMNPSIYVRASTTFASLVLTLAATRIHQLYFVDEQLHPIGSVRIGDVLKILVDEGPNII